LDLGNEEVSSTERCRYRHTSTFLLILLYQVAVTACLLLSLHPSGQRIVAKCDEERAGEASGQRIVAKCDEEGAGEASGQLKREWTISDAIGEIEKAASAAVQSAKEPDGRISQGLFLGRFVPVQRIA
jgi:hypothetical protein